MTETTALGAVYAAGLAVGDWRSLEELRGIERGETPLDAARERGRARARLRGSGTRPSNGRSAGSEAARSRVSREPAAGAGIATQEEAEWTTANASSAPSSSARSR